MEIVFTNPANLWMLVTIPLLIITHFFVLSALKIRAFRFANFEVIKRIVGPVGNERNVRMISSNTLLFLLRVFALLFLILAAAGITLWYQGRGSKFSYAIAIDASSSMLATDISPNRVEAAKNAAELFVKQLSKAKVGVIDFAGASFVKQTITDDMSSARASISNIEVENVGGTAIGDAIITSTNMLAQEDNARVIILITDGQNNVGADPKEGIEHANNENVVIYTIGIGSEQGGTFIKTELVSKLDEETLKMIAEQTGGRYFRAADEESLQNAYAEIAAVSTQKLSLKLSAPFILVAIILIFIEWTLLNTKYRTLP